MANLTSKELTALEDQLKVEQMVVAKYRGMASQCQDSVIKTKLEQIADKHQKHFDTIVTYLQ